VAKVAPKGYKLRATIESSAVGAVGSVAGTAAAVHYLSHSGGVAGYKDMLTRAGRRAEIVGKKIARAPNFGEKLKQIGKALKPTKRGLKAFGVAAATSGILGSAGSVLGYSHATKKGYNRLGEEVEKVAYHPESFTRNHNDKQQRFVENFSRKSTYTQMKEQYSPLGLLLTGAIAAGTKKYHDAHPSSPGPYVVGGLMSIITIKRWSSASKKERQRFVDEYNRQMGTTFKINHPKMKAY